MNPNFTTEHTWQGRHDPEDGQAGRRVHHIACPIQVGEIANQEPGVELTKVAPEPSTRQALLRKR